MAKLIIKNLDIQLEDVDQDKDILTLLKEAEIYAKSSCGGHASCGDCVIKISSGEDNLSPPPFEEIKLLGNVFHITKERLACQTKISGDVTIDLSAHNQAIDEERLRNKSPKKKPVKVRKSEDVSKMYEERKQESSEKHMQKEIQEESYYKHWEKKEDSEGKPVRKKLDGGKRPRPFVTPELEDSAEKPENILDKTSEIKSEEDSEKNSED